MNIPVEDLLANGESKKRGSGPAGKMRQLFEAASKLPRRQQEHVLKVVNALVAQASTEH